MDPKQHSGLCDFVFQRGNNRGRKCGKDGWADAIGFRCKKHRRSVVKCWHRIRNKNSLRGKYQAVLEELSQLRKELNETKKSLQKCSTISGETLPLLSITNS